MDIVFCGTPQFAVPSLERLCASGHQVRLVVTQPDRPRGRGLEVAASPVKEMALRHKLPLAQPTKIRENAELRKQLEDIHPDAIVVVGYGRLVPPWMLTLPRFGNINLHASLLPKYRGAAPIQWAIANGETVSGNTTMRLDMGLDTGDILLQEQLPIRPNDTALTYGSRLAQSGAVLLDATLGSLERGDISPIPQQHELATLAPILKKEDGRIDFAQPAQSIYNRWRGFQPWPGIYCFFREKQLKIIAAVPESERHARAPGALLLDSSGMLVGCGDHTTLQILEVQPEGRKPMAVRDFINGYRITTGERLT